MSCLKQQPQKSDVNSLEGIIGIKLLSRLNVIVKLIYYVKLTFQRNN